MARRTEEHHWQERLQDECSRRGWQQPQYNIFSDRRGGRTAWSCSVTLENQQPIAARMWYDGQYINNAKEDCAEVAIQRLVQPQPPPPQQAQAGQSEFWPPRDGNPVGSGSHYYGNSARISKVKPPLR